MPAYNPTEHEIPFWERQRKGGPITDWVDSRRCIVTSLRERYEKAEREVDCAWRLYDGCNDDRRVGYRERLDEAKAERDMLYERLYGKDEDDES